MKGNWLIRGGGILILLGFFLLSRIVLGMSDLAGQTMGVYSQPILYMVPICALVVIILSFLKPHSYSRALENLWGQVAATGIGALCLTIGMLSLFFPINYKLQFSGLFTGLVFLITGYLVLLAGFIFQWLAIEEASTTKTSYTTVTSARRSPSTSVHPRVTRPRARHPTAINTNPIRSGAQLEMVHGILLPSSAISIRSGNFSIGRARNNDLQLLDNYVSLQHARFRFTENKWFIQDQESTNGTYVNGQRIRATQLVKGDVIAIGRSTFVFFLR